MEFVEEGDYFFKTEKLHDVHFIVGENKERIGAVRNLLINQSQVWWTMLSEDSALVEKNDITLPDIEPEVFMLLLKHCYGGLDDLSQVATDLVVSLCYCANKYLMKRLMNKIAKRLEPTSVDELFPALHCLTVFNLSGVENAVQKMVQTETRQIFVSPQFLECGEESVTFIARQEPLECDELELWEAVLTWAKHRAVSCDGPNLRSVMSGPLKHIRLLTMPSDDLCQSVFQSKIFTAEEIFEICSKKISSSDICETTEVRRGPGKICSSHVVKITQGSGVYAECKLSSFAIFVKQQDILLNSLTCRSLEIVYAGSLIKTYIFNGWNLNYTRTVTMNIARLIDHMTGIRDEPTVISLSNFGFNALDNVTFPTRVNNKGVLLKANNKYMIDLKFNYNFAAWTSPNCVEGHDFKHGTFFCCQTYNAGVGTTAAHVLEFEYDVIEC